MCQLYVCVCVTDFVCERWLSLELSPQMGVQLFLNEFNYRDGTIHQNIPRSRAPNSSVAAEKQFGASLLFLCMFTQSHTEPESVKDLCLGTRGRQELGALWRQIQLGRGAKRLDGSTAKTNFFILYAVKTDLVQHSLSVALSIEQRRVFQCHTVAFSQLHF